MVECSNDFLTIDGNGGELPNEVLLGDAGCELRKNQYGTATLTLETKDEINSIDWQFRTSDEGCERKNTDKYEIQWDGETETCQFAFQTAEAIDNGSYKVKDADHEIALSLKIPALSNKSISCQLENSEYWDCDINVKMDFKKRSNPWSWIIALGVSVATLILMYLVWYYLIRNLSNFRAGNYRYTSVILDDVRRIDKRQNFSSNALREFNFNNHNIEWRSFNVPKGAREISIDDLTLNAKIAPAWKPHHVLQGGWGKVTKRHWVYRGNPPAIKPSSIRCDLTPTVIVGVDTLSSSETPNAKVYFILPSEARTDVGEKLRANGVQELTKLTDDFDNYESEIVKSSLNTTLGDLFSRINMNPFRKRSLRSSKTTKSKSDSSDGQKDKESTSKSDDNGKGKKSRFQSTKPDFNDVQKGKESASGLGDGDSGKRKKSRFQK